MSEESNAWIPEKEGDSIEGKLIDVATGSGYEGKPYPIITLDVDGVEVPIHAFHYVLRTELARRRPKIGDDVKIVYQGKTPDSKDRKGFHKYRVQGGQSQAYNWDNDLPPEERATAVQQQASDVDLPIDDVELPPAPPTAEEIAAARALVAAAKFGDDTPF
jgi:hypothetical protein